MDLLQTAALAGPPPQGHVEQRRPRQGGGADEEAGTSVVRQPTTPSSQRLPQRRRRRPRRQGRETAPGRPRRASGSCAASRPCCRLWRTGQVPPCRRKVSFRLLRILHRRNLEEELRTVPGEERQSLGCCCRRRCRILPAEEEDRCSQNRLRPFRILLVGRILVALGQPILVPLVLVPAEPRTSLLPFLLLQLPDPPVLLVLLQPQVLVVLESARGIPARPSPCSWPQLWPPSAPPAPCSSEGSRPESPWGRSPDA